MCFSPEVSFGAAAGLAAIGFASVRDAPTRSHLPFAAVPLVFAVQQASEGVLWLILNDAPFGKSATPWARVFLFFALFVWPLYMPASLYLIERVRTRRLALAALAVGGAVFGGYLLGCATLRESDACIAFGNIYYWVQVDTALKPAVPYLYAGIILVPFVVSSLRGTTLLAALIAVSFVVAGALFAAGFISVWCFFAAMLSAVVVIIIKARQPS